MELRDLRYFVVVAEYKNLAHAAEALDLSATALGKSLRRLEKSVGGKLVQRASKGVALTAVGASLLNRIAPLQGMLNDVRHEAADLIQGRAGHINVGSNAGTQDNRLANAYVSLQKESPAITLTVTVSDNIVLSKALHKGELDFCVAGPRALPPTEFVHEHLYDDPFVVYASARHRLAKRRQVSIAELAGERWATSNSTSLPQWQALFRAFENNGLSAPCIALETNSVAFTTFAVAHSNHVGLCSIPHLRREALRLPLVELPVKEAFPVRRIFIIYRKGAYLSPAALRLIAILKMQAKETSAGGRAARMK
jgi:DNA-binding transcriptional LysR family regulator